MKTYAHDPFGTVVNEDQPFRFVGQFGVMADPNGFYYIRARFCGPSVGRFVSENPMGFDGRDVNLYVYAGNNPIMRMDPSGQWLVDNIIGGFGGAFGGFNAALTGHSSL